MSAPYPEPQGCLAEPSFCKDNPLNNDYYVEQFEDDPWYPAIKYAHDRLTKKYPGYNIVQIKEKFNGLRYYIARGDCPEDVWDVHEADLITTQAEFWVSGFEAGRKFNA